MENPTVLYRREDNIGIITLNRPERLNAINKDLLRDLIHQLHTAREDREAVVIVLTGAGRAFCAGEDLKETSAGKSLETWIEETDGLQEVQRVIMKLGKPLIAAVRGYALGGGCEFAMSCDIRIASQDARFGFPETGLGLTVTTAGTKLLSQLVGLGKAKELVFTGEFIQAEEALRIGLVNRVVPGEALWEEVQAMARKIGERSPLALKLSRIALDQGLHASFEQILELEANHLLICVGAQNQKDFVEKKMATMKKD
ncbi:MAG: enoyl-CoA hydratase/isomerase family protein [Candidatus Tectomicrobia bacterium]|uniref:Enoyl-CoA hydratase/isomerase family protein n=1 Tax=Tectimicrobiota bacterium TaxID=2528274 RepID=A0A932CQ07_UNCTE|nr:enoyl-CoA hydratase/isomerase family protein [Candidatus Tectomicrobia bacterium]